MNGNDAIMIGLAVMAALWLRQEEAGPEPAARPGSKPDGLVAECACAQ